MQRERAVTNRMPGMRRKFEATKSRSRDSTQSCGEVQSTLTWRLHDRLFALAPVRAVYRALLSLRSKAVGGSAEPATGISSTASGSQSEPAEPKLACVVMGLGNPDSLVDAVRSLQSQDLPVEIVVVNSGGGHPVQRLRAAGIEVKVLHRPDVLYPGAVRNLGIAATTAPFVSFLAADCQAEPGWVRARLDRTWRDCRPCPAR